MCTFKERGAIARTMGADSTAAGLTEEQAAVYDRQLRVWGVEAQRRLGASRVLVAGLTGLAAEACKNVALAGVGAVVLYDDGAPAKDAAPGNFLAAAGLADAAGTPDAEGLTVAAATAATLREMNPFGEISILAGPSDLSGIDVAAVTGCDAVLVAGCPLAVAERINDACREAGSAFFHGECRATSANFFADLGPDFRYTVEKRSTEKEADAGAVDTAMSASFVTLREAARCGWKSLGDGREGGVRRGEQAMPGVAPRRPLRADQRAKADARRRPGHARGVRGFGEGARGEARVAQGQRVRRGLRERHRVGWGDCRERVARGGGGCRRDLGAGVASVGHREG